jgi:hypothetical protein
MDQYSNCTFSALGDPRNIVLGLQQLQPAFSTVLNDALYRVHSLSSPERRPCGKILGCPVRELPCCGRVPSFMSRASHGLKPPAITVKGEPW